VSKGLKVLDAAKANPAGLSFSDLQALAIAAGYRLARTRGDHFIYSRPKTPEIINLQPTRGKAKTYQVRQVLGIIEKYGIKIE